MPKIKVYFSDGSTEIFHEEQSFVSISFIEENNSDDLFASKGKIYGLYSHIDAGLLPSFLELLANSKYFSDVENENIVFSSSAITKIERL
ncbi:hypothetical protein [Carnobacterium divergens]|uniref:hypothetical protein n=1 Tax=Carnobacterium divergens TaxID=2748 RepID=UPI001073BEDE|nr:hypothetical protein [Carnobacterium divergens]TFI86939.1 hypothetical protein CKN61_12910 [Carnobacterium divergens]